MDAFGLALGKRPGVISHCGEGSGAGPSQRKAAMCWQQFIAACAFCVINHDGLVCDGRLP